ncbi:MAG: carboxypeptidase-like regulatory domain-containing protein [Planctomycetota bacterium]|jgi:hypothetical protein
MEGNASKARRTAPVGAAPEGRRKGPWPALCLALGGALLLAASGTLRAGTQTQEEAAPASGAQARTHFERLAQMVREHKEETGYYPAELADLDGETPKDVYSPEGEGYRYEATRRRFVISSCGPDGAHGTEDDPVFVGHYRDERVGPRAEIYPLEQEDPDAQYEFTQGARPEGTCAVSGRVLSLEAGKPISHAEVVLSSMDRARRVYVHVAADGSFAIRGIAAGWYTLETEAADYLEAHYRAPGAPAGGPWGFKVDEGQAIDQVELALERAKRISGRVLDGDGEPLKDPEGLRVIAWGHRSRRIWSDGDFDFLSIADLDPDNGSYSIGQIERGPVRLQVFDGRAGERDVGYPPCYYPGVFAPADAELITFEDAPTVEGARDGRRLHR